MEALTQKFVTCNALTAAIRDAKDRRAAIDREIADYQDLLAELRPARVRRVVSEDIGSECLAMPCHPVNVSHWLSRLARPARLT